MKKPILVLLLLFGFLIQTSYATDGYFRNGYGIKYSALAGSGIAVSLSSLGAINNPASIINLNNQLEFNLSLFSPMRDYTITGNPSGLEGTFGLTPGKIESDKTSFFFPTLGGNMKVADNMAVALSIYGNGGMNTDYPTSTFYDQTSPGTGVNLEQMFVSGTYAIEFVKNHSLGISAVFGWQRFAAKGLIAFSMFSSDPADLTGNSFSTSTGFGFKIGYQGKLTDWLKVGAAYQSKMMMSEFKRYAGLFAQQGDFDIPSSWTAGVAVMPHKDWTLLLDVKQILYSEIKAINNPMIPNLQTSLLGYDDGAGFGWKDVLAVKFGAMFTGVESWDFMAGYSYNQNPIPESEVMFNILAPAVVQNHVTAGFTKHIGTQNEVSLAFMYALDNSVTGENPLEYPGQQTIKIAMRQWQVEIGYAFSFVQ
ncbi:MAG: outer membrane protein transport protein [Ignavibacteriaceae bacterium]|jgi:long-chain fatty acid transport protein|nr:outer membrane protein transport protein [Ignavibacteriaceae bacterium]MCW8814057.1 outer membrane protein transport protein [Chlorobium sp.]MCW8817472.1 outer membrane protein transport protein [Ignavibacteriaceae bacterium]MCW9094686.1 outer membrane protein transport protein [Ignavibacteriaceae bacterium]